MFIDQTKAMSRRLYEGVFSRGNVGAADEILHVECVNHGPGALPAIGREQIKRQATLLRTAMPDFDAVLNDQLAEGDRVVSRWTGRGTHTGPLAIPTGAVPPSGRAVAFDEIRIDRFDGGRIVES